MSSTCNEVFVKPYIESDTFLEDHERLLIEKTKESLQIDLSSKRKFKIYSLRQSEKGAHKSIVLTPNDKRFVSVELTFRTFDGYKRTIPQMRPIPDSLKPKMKYVGAVTATGLELISKAMKVMMKFGTYFKPCHNCQDFCNMYVKEIGLGWKARELTDGDQASIIATVLGLILGGVFSLFK